MFWTSLTHPHTLLLNTHIIGTDSQGDVLAELALEGLVVLLLQDAHVVGHVQSEDVLTVHLSVQLLLLGAAAESSGKFTNMYN